jgi:hypothetical protein
MDAAEKKRSFDPVGAIQSSRDLYTQHAMTSIVIIIIESTALGRPWPPQANVASDLYPRHPPANFYNLQPSSLASSSTPSIHLDFGQPRPR